MTTTQLTEFVSEHQPPVEPAAPTCLIVGLGNCLMRDDGIGVHVVRELMKELPEDVLALEVGTDVFSAIPWLERVPWVLAIDAMDAGGPPGSLYHCAATDIAAPVLPKSLHELGLLSVLEFIPPEHRPEIRVLGVQPEVVDYGLELSPVLTYALPQVLHAAKTILAGRASKMPAGLDEPIHSQASQARQRCAARVYSISITCPSRSTTGSGARRAPRQGPATQRPSAGS